MTRDAMRSAVYAVEHSVFAETLFSDPVGAAGMLDLAGLVADSGWWQRNGTTFEIAPTRREAQHSSATAEPAGGGPAQIRISVHQEDAATLAHELAHLLAGSHGATPPHGPTFIAAELDVVSLVCGTIAARRMSRAFSEAGIAASARTWEPPDPLEDRGLFGCWRLARLVGDHAGGEPGTSG
ncbi:MAG TPA: hypothetical protein VFN21_07235 [Acidimicrobiales bacterium]|nr:hypothetical protein [Acidimicrobiales bacterium]